jgi:hypothetical protein
VIESGAFAESGLERLEIPGSVEVLGDRCFSRCSELREVLFAAACRVQVFGELVFEQSGLECLELAIGWPMIPNGWFLLCDRTDQSPFIIHLQGMD